MKTRPSFGEEAVFAKIPFFSATAVIWRFKTLSSVAMNISRTPRKSENRNFRKTRFALSNSKAVLEKKGATIFTSAPAFRAVLAFRAATFPPPTTNTLKFFALKKIGRKS
jgi:hypothetical protein